MPTTRTTASDAAGSIDPRAALLLLLLVVVACTALPMDARQVLPAAAIIVGIWRFGVLRPFVRRFLLILPMTLGMGLFLLLRHNEGEVMLRFGSMIITHEALESSLLFQARVLLLAAASLLFGLGVPMRDLVAAMRFFRVPETAVSVAWMTERFFSLMLADSSRMLLAVRARSLRLSLPLRITLAGRMASTFLLRGVVRSERLGDALLARGFDGRVPVAPELRWMLSDSLLCFAGSVLVLIMWVLR